MKLSSEEVPSLLFWILVLGAASYATVKIVGVVRDKVDAVMA